MMVLNGAHPLYDQILAHMEPGLDYTAAELAYLSKQSRNVVGGQLRKATACGRVVIVGTAKTGYRTGNGYVYRLVEE